MAKAKVTETATRVNIPAARIASVNITLVGIGAGLLVNRFSETKMSLVEAKALGEAKSVKAPRNYETEFEEARYVVDGKDVYPCATIKKRVVEGCSFVDGVFMKVAKGGFFIMDEYAEIISDPPELHKAMAKVGSGMNKVPQMRIRPLYRNWKIPITIRYDENILTVDQIVHLFTQTGFSIGLGEWTAQHHGSFGMFEVESSRLGIDRQENGNGQSRI